MVKKYHKWGLDDASHSSNGALDFPKPPDNLSPFFSVTPFSSQIPETRFCTGVAHLRHVTAASPLRRRQMGFSY
jgi:hypothetical protein